MGRMKQGLQKNRGNGKPDVILIVKEQSGLLDFLLRSLPRQSRNNVKSLLKYKEVYVDGVSVTRHDYALQIGQRVEIKKPYVRDDGHKKPLDIVYEDKDIIVINKPAGLLTIATEKENERTAYHMLMEYVKCGNQNNRIFIVHRLDRDTSGLLVFAKNEQFKLLLQENWADIVTERGYVAVVEGVLKDKERTITSWLKETKTHLMYSSGVTGDGLCAITRYEVIKSSSAYSLLSISLETGRKNQIRVHMKDIGHPIAGDKKYGAAGNPLKRLCLHANLLEFNHPVTKELMRFETKVPKQFSLLLKGAVNPNYK